jgi:acyl-ACP thioesterase
MFSMTGYIGASCIDEDGELKLGSLGDFLQDCSLLHIFNNSLIKKYFDKNNVLMVLLSRQIDIFRIPEYGEKIRLDTWVYECKASYGYRNTVIYNADTNEPLAASNAVGVYINSTSFRPVRVAQELIETQQIEPAFKMEYCPRKVPVPDNLTPINVTKALRTHLDFNKHVNNSRYFDIAENFGFPEDIKWTYFNRIRVEYKSSAKLHDKINLSAVYVPSENKQIIAMKDDNGGVYNTMEFSVANCSPPV